ncbi:MAG: GNAT family N-acetyltransferase [Roseobacter sp.]
MSKQLWSDFQVRPVERVQADEPDVARAIQRHFELMRSLSPPESCHVLPADALAAADIQLFALRQKGQAVAIGAIKLTGRSAELKSMHTLEESRGQGLGRDMLCGLMQEASRLGVKRLELETGSGPEHAAARGLYRSEGFSECPPFGSYTNDPLSLFLARDL